MGDGQSREVRGPTGGLHSSRRGPRTRLAAAALLIACTASTVGCGAGDQARLASAESAIRALAGDDAAVELTLIDRGFGTGVTCEASVAWSAEPERATYLRMVNEIGPIMAESPIATCADLQITTPGTKLTVEGHTYAEASIPWTDLAVYVFDTHPDAAAVRWNWGDDREPYGISILRSVSGTSFDVIARVGGSIIQSPDAAGIRAATTWRFSNGVAADNSCADEQIAVTMRDTPNDWQAEILRSMNRITAEVLGEGSSIRGEMEFDDPRLLKARLTLWTPSWPPGTATDADREQALPGSAAEAAAGEVRAAFDVAGSPYTLSIWVPHAIPVLSHSTYEHEHED